MKGFARGLVLKQRHKVTQRRPTENETRGKNDPYPPRFDDC